MKIHQITLNAWEKRDENDVVIPSDFVGLFHRVRADAAPAESADRQCQMNDR